MTKPTNKMRPEVRYQQLNLLAILVHRKCDPHPSFPGDLFPLAWGDQEAWMLLVARGQVELVLQPQLGVRITPAGEKAFAEGQERRRDL